MFMQGRGCADQVFAVRHVCGKYLANGKDLFCALIHLEKAYDTIDRHGMRQMLRAWAHQKRSSSCRQVRSGEVSLKPSNSNALGPPNA